MIIAIITTVNVPAMFRQRRTVDTGETGETGTGLRSVPIFIAFLLPSSNTSTMKPIEHFFQPSSRDKSVYHPYPIVRYEEDERTFRFIRSTTFPNTERLPVVSSSNGTSWKSCHEIRRRIPRFGAKEKGLINKGPGTFSFWIKSRLAEDVTP